MLRMKLDRVEPYVYQWDTKQYVNVVGQEPQQALIAFAAHKDSDKALNIGTVYENRFKIPDILLQDEGPIVIYLVDSIGGQNTTLRVQTVAVKSRPKPDGYIYTEEDLLSWESIDRRVKKLEKEQFFLSPDLSTPGSAADSKIVGQALVDNWEKTQQLVNEQHNTDETAHQDIRDKIDAIHIPVYLKELLPDKDHRVVTDLEKDYWNAKSEFSGEYADLANIPKDIAKTQWVLNQIIDYIKKHNDDVQETDEQPTHPGIRAEIASVAQRLDNFLGTVTEDPDTLQELVDFISTNTESIKQLAEISANKIDKSSIVDNLTTQSKQSVLSANQGYKLKGIIDSLNQTLTQAIEDTNAAIPTKLEQLSETEKSCHVSQKERTLWNSFDDGKLSRTGGTMIGAINMGKQKIIDMANGEADQDAVTVLQLNRVDKRLSKFYTPKGSVQRYSELPKKNNNGDVYFVIEDELLNDTTYYGQHKYAWIENGWLDLGFYATIDSSLSTEGRAADAKKVGDEVAALKEKDTTLGGRIDALNNTLVGVNKYFNLQHEIVNTTQFVTKNEKGDITEIKHQSKDSKAILRTDTFIYSGDTVTETRVLSTGEKMVIVLNLKSLSSEITALG